MAVVKRHNIAHFKGNIHHMEYRSGGQYFWSHEEGENDAPFKLIGISDPDKIVQYVRGIVGYTPDYGCFPYCDTLEDVLMVCEVLTREINGTAPKKSGYELKSPFTIGTQRGYFDEHCDRYYWAGNTSQLNELSVCKYDFQKSVLGYTFNEGDFPWCKTLEDLATLCFAYNTLITQPAGGYKLPFITKSETLSYEIPPPVIIKVPKI